MSVPKWVDCKNCNNENTIQCVNCIAKYKTAHYLNYSEKYSVVTYASTGKVTAKTWKCLNCSTVYHSELGREIPSLCKMCGGNGEFERVE
jgi:hypothetical protein